SPRTQLERKRGGRENFIIDITLTTLNLLDHIFSCRLNPINPRTTAPKEQKKRELIVTGHNKAEHRRFCL
ncbi:hypothetical protein, partial [Thiolapillus sp.]|uniref:hypothetical protein n=1 Tax=Thiolapillus sp. TaxID=2017437 RepID=UPI003AF88568